ncbi:hypothetical protein B9479_007154 [Cryptococcus floricola]|uniref:BTB domain-containing protein n=1 Tax=Cryptococcus floricola TaxID=2591691 RepID=A0A5D3ANJ2_9TREE|nr:hypothetical protein B9479_007154 [Cryptococcus floricola]
MSVTDTEYAVSETWKATDGQSPTIKVISSDNVVLHVPEFLLEAHSVVLREMLKDLSPPSLSHAESASISSPDRSPVLEFTDATMESEATLTFFFSIISGKDLEVALEESTTTDYVPTFYYAMSLARKWDCAIATQLLKSWLNVLVEKVHTHPHFKPLDVFMIAAKHDLPNVAARVIAVYKMDESCLTRPSSGRWAFLPSNKPFEAHSLERTAWNDTPVAYLHALALTPNVAQDQVVPMSRCSNCRNILVPCNATPANELAQAVKYIQSSQRAAKFLNHLQNS